MTRGQHKSHMTPLVPVKLWFGLSEAESKQFTTARRLHPRFDSIASVYVLWLTSISTFSRMYRLNSYLNCRPCELKADLSDIFGCVLVIPDGMGDWWEPPPPTSLSLSPWRRVCPSVQAPKAVAHCLCEHGRPKAGGSYIFVLLEEDRWFCVWLSPRKCSLMSVQAAVMARGYGRDEGYRQQVPAAIGQI